MAARDGNKHDLQLLMDNAKFQLLEQDAQERGLKTTALARDAEHEWLSMNANPDLSKGWQLMTASNC